MDFDLNFGRFFGLEIDTFTEAGSSETVPPKESLNRTIKNVLPHAWTSDGGEGPLQGVDYSDPGSSQRHYSDRPPGAGTPGDGGASSSLRPSS